MSLTLAHQRGVSKRRIQAPDRRKILLRKLYLVLIAVGLGLPALAVSRPVSAAGIDLTCPFSVSVSASPGLGLTMQSQSVTGSLKGGSSLSEATPCSSITGIPNRGATGVIRGSGTQNCLLQGSLSGTIDVTWDNGDRSSVTWSEVLVLFAPVVRASITSGALQGRSTASALASNVCPCFRLKSAT